MRVGRIKKNQNASQRQIASKKLMGWTAMILGLVMLSVLLTACGQGVGAAESNQAEPVAIRIGSLKGPTTLGILDLMDRAQKGETYDSYEFRMATGADELLPLMAQGDLDIALVPANIAAVLYQRTQGEMVAVDINTLGVLYVVTGSPEIISVADLAGKTIYLTGMGTTPEASLCYVLKQNGLSESDYTLEFKSEAAEVAAVLAEDPESIGLLPQPFVTAALLQNSSLGIALNLNEEWNKVQGEDGSSMVTGVTLVRRDFLEEHPLVVERFLEEHAASVEAVNTDPDTGAILAVQAQIVANESIARQAIPNCNIVCITGQEMKTALSGYLKVLADFEPTMIGGQVPGDDFYYEN